MFQEAASCGDSMYGQVGRLQGCIPFIYRCCECLRLMQPTVQQHSKLKYNLIVPGHVCCTHELWYYVGGREGVFLF